MKIDAVGAAILCLYLGFALLVWGVFVLVGQGWALVTASLPFLGLGAVLSRGLMRG